MEGKIIYEKTYTEKERKEAERLERLDDEKWMDRLLRLRPCVNSYLQWKKVKRMETFIQAAKDTADLSKLNIVITEKAESIEVVLLMNRTVSMFTLQALFEFADDANLFIDPETGNLALHSILNLTQVTI